MANQTADLLVDGHRLGRARLIDIRAHHHGRVICDELHVWHRPMGSRSPASWKRKCAQCGLMNLMGAFRVGDQNDLAAARRTSCKLEAFPKCGRTGNDDHRHLLVDEAMGPCELARRIPFGMDVRRFP